MARRWVGVGGPRCRHEEVESALWTGSASENPANDRGRANEEQRGERCEAQSREQPPTEYSPRDLPLGDHPVSLVVPVVSF